MVDLLSALETPIKICFVLVCVSVFMAISAMPNTTENPPVISQAQVVNIQESVDQAVNGSLPEGWYIVEADNKYRWVDNDGFMTRFDYDSYGEAVEAAWSYFEFETKKKREDDIIWKRVEPR